MVSTIYVEEAVREHPRVRRIRDRFRKARVVFCDQYSEIFNPRAQNFRLQKLDPALILARKNDGLVMHAPGNYNIGIGESYYFSHMLNCVYDCRYCFLQGMFRSAHYLHFVNYEDFARAITEKLTGVDGRNPTWFFSGYDCDSLAYEPVTGFAGYFLPFFARHPDAYLELRTKSTQIRALLRRTPLSNVVVAFSFTPAEISRRLERGVPALEPRLEAIRRLQCAGWQVGLRFDPLIYVDDFKPMYEGLIEKVFSSIDADSVHSVSLGSFRMPKDYFKTIARLYPEEPLYAMPTELGEDRMVSYPTGMKTEMLEYVAALLLKWIPRSRFFNHEQSISAMAPTVPTELI